jgi:ABC-type Fe3+-hydroxamate transport system substrate-binding protein
VEPKKFNFEAIDALHPDLIIGNKEENYLEGITQLRTKYPVWMSDIVSLQDAYSMIASLGELTGTSPRAIMLRDQIAQRLLSIKKRSAKKVLYLIWRNPWMAVGSGTFIHSMLTQMNLANALGGSTRYPELSSEQIAALRPDFIFLSSEPFPFGEKHVDELRAISGSSQIILVDGEMFSWYGSRLLHAAEYLNGLNLGE